VKHIFIFFRKLLSCFVKIYDEQMSLLTKDIFFFSAFFHRCFHFLVAKRKAGIKAGMHLLAD